MALLSESTVSRKEKDCKAGYICKIHPKTMAEVSQSRICYRDSPVECFACDIVGKTGQGRKNRDLPCLWWRELQWLSGLQTCAALNLCLPESTGLFDFSPSCPVHLAFQLAWNAEGNRNQQHMVLVPAVLCSHAGKMLPWPPQASPKLSSYRNHWLTELGYLHCCIGLIA